MKKLIVIISLFLVMMSFTSCLTMLGAALMSDSGSKETTATNEPGINRDQKTTDRETKDRSTTEKQQKGAEESETAALDKREIRQSVKDAIDSYEAFVDEYCEFMASYSITDLTQLPKYLDLLQKEIDMTKNFEALESDLTDAETFYYLEVSSRCSSKMLDATLSKLKK